MSNRLEKFIRDNREEFDNEEPRSQLWKNLKGELETGKRKNDSVFHLSFLRWTAAAAILVMMLGMFYYMNRQQPVDRIAGSEPALQSDDKLLNAVNPTYAKEMYHFTQLIELKQNELKQIEKEHPELYSQFVKDIHKLDSSYQALRAELPANPDPETLLEAMLQNLRLQADLLNQQLTIIKQIKSKKTVMKRIHVLLSNVLLLTLLLTSAAYAQNKKYDYEKSRSISQSYNASGNDKLSINNQFGKVTIKTWSKNEVKVDISIQISSTLKEEAEDMFERIDVNHDKNGSNISFKTTMNKNGEKNQNKQYSGTHSNSINIDYEVSMPAGITLDLENRFGKTTLPDLQGKVDIDQQFGDLEAGRLSNPGKISVRFGSADIESVDGGSYDFQFVNNTAVIKNASGDIKVKVQHCKNNGVVIHAANASSVDVDAQHSDVAVVVPREMSANYVVETHFGSFKNNSSFSIKQQGEDDDNRRGPQFNHTYKGSSGQGRTKITLDGNFTDFFIGHDAPPAKAKNEKKTRSV